MTTVDDPLALRRGDFPVLRDLPTRWSDDDTYGHVNNAVHYQLFDTAVNGWLIEASGTDIRRLPAVGLVVETQCRYLAELRFPEVHKVIQSGVLDDEDDDFDQEFAFGLDRFLDGVESLMTARAGAAGTRSSGE